MRILLTGGVKSGKSRRALELSEPYGPGKRFLATAEAFDDEMRDRIAKHRAERSELGFITIEERYAIDEAVAERTVLDCIPMWLNNLFFADREAEWPAILDRLIARLPRDIVIVTNEIGMGVIPADPVSRRYGVALGTINARLAAAVDSVELLVAGIPLKVK